MMENNIPTEQENSMEELKRSGIDLIDEFFPKNKCKERGQAIVLYAALLIKFEEFILEDRKRIVAPWLKMNPVFYDNIAMRNEEYPKMFKAGEEILRNAGFGEK